MGDKLLKWTEKSWGGEDKLDFKVGGGKLSKQTSKKKGHSALKQSYVPLKHLIY